MRAFALVALAGCSVPPLSLEGKQCPCTDGYVCDELTKRCLAVNDGGTIIDTPGATQCLPSDPGETEVYRYANDFAMWTHEDNSWTGDAQGIHQNDNGAQNSYAYRVAAPLTSSPNVRVIATLLPEAQGTGSPALGIVLRTQLSPQDKERYSCSWSSKDRQLRIEVFAGNNPTMIGGASVAANVQIPPSLTMEASVSGSSIACCVREIAAARATAMDTSVTMGYPGVSTSRMEATFGSFVVFKRP